MIKIAQNTCKRFYTCFFISLACWLHVRELSLTFIKNNIREKKKRRRKKTTSLVIMLKLQRNIRTCHLKHFLLCLFHHHFLYYCFYPQNCVFFHRGPRQYLYIIAEMFSMTYGLTILTIYNTNIKIVFKITYPHLPSNFYLKPLVYQYDK